MGYKWLDNLKLGFGGTKQEMQRLLADATKLSGVKYDISNLSDVYEAIHVIQEDLGITGTTAKEASTTFQGSFKAMASAAKNLIGNLSIGADIKEPLQSLVKTTTTFLVGNLLPMVGNIVKALPGALKVLFDSVRSMLPANLLDIFWNIKRTIDNKFPIIIHQGTLFIRNFINGLLNGLPDLLGNIRVMLIQSLYVLLDNIPMIIASAQNIMVNFMQAMVDNFPMIVEQIINFIVLSVGAILECLPMIIESAYNLISAFLSGLVSSFPQIIAQIPLMLSNIAETFMEFDWMGLGKQIIDGIARGITKAVTSLIGAAIDACKSLVDGVKDFFGIHSPSRLMANEIGKYIPEGMAVGITRNLNVLDSAGKQMKMSVLNSVKDINGNNAFNSLKFNGFKANTSRNQLGGNINQTINITSPKALNPSEVARQTRNSTRNLLLQVQGG